MVPATDPSAPSGGRSVTAPVDDAETRRHLAELVARGFTVVERAMSPQEVRAARKALGPLLAHDAGVHARLAIGAAYREVENLAGKGRPFETFFASPLVLGLAEAVLGPECILHDVWAFGVPPGATADHLHIDEPDPSLGVPVVLSAIFALGRFDDEVGATCVIPGSHRERTRPPIVLACDPPESVAVEVPPGGCLLLLGSLWHGTGANRSDETRLTIAAKYSRPWLKPRIDLTRSLSDEVIDRASETTRRLFGFASLPPFTETWEWDRSSGKPKDGRRHEPPPR